jgi:hypothetical protein
MIEPFNAPKQWRILHSIEDPQWASRADDPGLLEADVRLRQDAVARLTESTDRHLNSVLKKRPASAIRAHVTQRLAKAFPPISPRFHHLFNAGLDEPCLAIRSASQAPETL